VFCCWQHQPQNTMQDKFITCWQCNENLCGILLIVISMSIDYVFNIWSTIKSVTNALHMFFHTQWLCCAERSILFLEKEQVCELCIWVRYLYYLSVWTIAEFYCSSPLCLEVLILLPARRYASNVFATATCLSVRLSICLSQAGIVPSRVKAGSWNVHHLIAPWFWFLARYESSKNSQGVTPKERAKWGWCRFFVDFRPICRHYLENGAF